MSGDGLAELRETVLAIYRTRESGLWCYQCSGTGNPQCPCDGQYCRCTPGFGRLGEHCIHCDGIGVNSYAVKAFDSSMEAVDAHYRLIIEAAFRRGQAHESRPDNYLMGRHGPYGE